MGLSQAAFSEKTGLLVTSYKKYEQNQREPGADAIGAFVRAGINANWLLSGEGKMLQSDKARTDQPVPPIDAETLAFVIESLETGLSKRKLTIDAVRKANLIQLMYEYCLLDSGNKQAGTAEKFLKLVA